MKTKRNITKGGILGKAASGLLTGAGHRALLMGCPLPKTLSPVCPRARLPALPLLARPGPTPNPQRNPRHASPRPPPAGSPSIPGVRADPAVSGSSAAGGIIHIFSSLPRLCQARAAAAAQAMAGSGEALALHVLLCCLCGGKRRGTARRSRYGIALAERRSKRPGPAGEAEWE